MNAIPCPAGTPWCAEHEVDGDGTQICQSTDTELDSGWSISLADFHDGHGPQLTLTDPDCYLAATLTGRMSVPAACDLLAGLAAMVRDAQALPHAARAAAN